MSLALEQFVKAQKVFKQQSDIAVINKTMVKVTMLVNNLMLGNLPDSPKGTKGRGFAILTGDELSTFQTKLAGYKFYMADIIGELQGRSKFVEAYIKDYKAQNWLRVRDEITEREGKVKNKELIDNELVVELKDDINSQVFYEAEYQKIRAKSHAIENVLTAIVQRISELKRQKQMAENA